MTVRCISGSVLWNGQVSKSMTTIEKAIALGIKAAAAHSPTSDAEYVSAHVGKYLASTLWTYGPMPVYGHGGKDVVDRKWPRVDPKWPRVDPKWPQYASRSGRALHAPR